MNSVIKPKKCAHCKTAFTPFRPLQKVCSPHCAAEVVKSVREKQERKDLYIAKQKIKTRSEWLAEAQRWFNKFIRLRDANDSCISCGHHHTGQYHAGHFRSVGSSPQLRFNELNCHKQCSVCNNYLSGNQLKYRERLITKIGQSQVEQLEADNEAAHYSIDEIKAIKGIYKQKCKELEHG